MQDLAEIHAILRTCRERLLQIPARYPDWYISVPTDCLNGITCVCCELEEFAIQLAKIENLPVSTADLSLYFHQK